MKLKQLSKPVKKIEPVKPVIEVEECIKLIKSLLQDIEDFEEEFADDDYYGGILTPRSSRLLKKLLPEEYSKLEIG